MTQLQAKQVSQALRKLANKEVAKTHSSFFKTGKGEYGEGDKFLGIKVPQSRDVAKKFAALPLGEIAELAKSEYHEERFTAVVILVNQFKKQKTESDKKKYFDFYLKLINSGSVNNWDLIDVSAPYLGAYLLDKGDALDFLLKLSKSKNLWNQRAAIMLTGKRSIQELRDFLSAHAETMPRTMLRYAIERMTETERKKWLSQRAG